MLRQRLSDRPDPQGLQAELDSYMERCLEQKSEITNHQAAARVVEEDHARITARHEKLMRSTVNDANELASKANKATRRSEQLKEALKAAKKENAARSTRDEAEEIAEEEAKAGLREKVEDLTCHSNELEAHLT